MTEYLEVCVHSPLWGIDSDASPLVWIKLVTVAQVRWQNLQNVNYRFLILLNLQYD